MSIAQLQKALQPQGPVSPSSGQGSVQAPLTGPAGLSTAVLEALRAVDAQEAPQQTSERPRLPTERHARPGVAGALALPTTGAMSLKQADYVQRIASLAIDPTGQGRPLTPGERALAMPYFGLALDYDRVRVFARKHNPFQGDATLMAPNGHIFAPPGVYDEDFARAPKHLQAAFVHEMTHVWQEHSGHQVLIEGALLHMFRTDPYAFTLETGKGLRDFNIEQQASIIEQHFLWKHDANVAQLCNFPPLADFERTLAELFADPLYERRAYESLWDEARSRELARP